MKRLEVRAIGFNDGCVTIEGDALVQPIQQGIEGFVFEVDIARRSARPHHLGKVIHLCSFGSLVRQPQSRFNTRS